MSKVIRYGDNVDTDVIIPARYLNITDVSELATHAMEDIDPGFHHKLAQGNIIVAGKNFGCGSSREHAPLVLKQSGVSVVIAESFARIFFRNAINIGLAIIECPEASSQVSEGDDLVVDFQQGVITNRTQGSEYHFAAFPEFLTNIIDNEGLIALIAKGGLR